jgi:RimJ/RimL family protein N-acetyltransferase
MTHAVIVSTHRQYAVWPSRSPLPAGWETTGWTGTEQSCLDRVAEVWSDGRPEAVARIAAEDAARPAPQLLTTDRLWLREALPEEAREITDGATCGLSWVGGAPSAETRVAARMLVRAEDAGAHLPGWGMYLLMRTEDAAVVGAMGFHGPPADGSVEIGFDLAEAARGHGYATEALRELARWAQSRPGVSTVVATTTADNHASRAVIERAGFTRMPDGDDGSLVYRFAH